MDDKAQISAELLIIMAAIIAVAVLLIQGINSSSKAASSKLSTNSESALKKIGEVK